MKLIDTDALLQAAKMNGFAGESAVKFLMLLMRFRRINKIYQENAHRTGIDFIDAMMEQLGVRYEIRPEELEKIPREGSFVTVSNHPFGGIDGLLLIKLIGSIRPDYKIIPNFLLRRMEPVADYTFKSDGSEALSDDGITFSGIKKALAFLESGKPMGIFPAGEVSSFDEDIQAITDPQWQYRTIRLLKMAKVPVVPVYFQGKNSRLFHFLGRIHPKLQTVKLPTELFSKRKRVINIRIGTPIAVREQNEFGDINRYGRYLRSITYALGTSLEVKQFFRVHRRQLKKAEEIIGPVPVNRIGSEISKITANYLLFKIETFCVFCAPSFEIPNIMNEIGRLREITFRDVGEGTNQQMDIDEYDLYYNQLFIWDEEKRKIVGAYRVGKGQEIMDIYGVRGFYIQSLFRIHRRLHPILSQSLELGRSFIIPEYQRRPLPLFLLWKGILYFLLKNPEYRYLIGPVSISNRFSKFSKELIIKFITEYYYNEGIARYIRPRKKFTVSLHHLDTDILIESASDLNKFDRIIKDIETAQKNMPVLLKKYLKQNGKIVGFNIDPKFNNALDGLLVLDLFDVPPDTISALSKEVDDKGILERFASSALGQIGTDKSSPSNDPDENLVNVTLNGTGVIPPSVTTIGASNVATSSATLSGNLTALGAVSSVNVSFEYGLTTSYGSNTTPQEMLDIGPFSANITGLTSGATYHFRAKAEGDGTAYGDDMQFTTTAIQAPAGGGGGGGPAISTVSLTGLRATPSLTVNWNGVVQETTQFQTSDNMHTHMMNCHKQYSENHRFKTHFSMLQF